MNKCKFFYAVMIAAAMASCVKEELKDPGTGIPEGCSLQEFKVISEQTKSEVDAVGNTVWSTGDAIKIFWDGGSGSATLVGDGGQTSGVFSGAVPDGKKVNYAVYPASLTSSVEGDVVTVSIPSSQDGSFAAGNIAVSAVDDENVLKFTNVNAFLKIQLKSDEITKIVVESVDGSALVGKQPVSFGGEPPALGTPSETSSSVTMTAGAKGRYYISVLPGVTHSKGLLLKYFKGESVSGTYFLDKNVTTARNKVLAFGEFEPDGNYYVTVTGAGKKNGVDWANAMTPAQMGKLILANASESAESKAARLLAINGAVFHMGAGEHNLGASQTVSFSETEPVVLTFIGGYGENGSEGRDLANNESAFSGAGEHAALILNGGVNATFDGVGFVNSSVDANEKGALECVGATTSVTLTNCFVKNNTNTLADGACAGIQLTSCGSFTATGCVISGNTAYASPAMYMRNTSVNMTSCKFENNVASNNTGAFRITGGNTSNFTECEFINNKANGGDRGAVNHNAGTSTFTDCVFSGNQASSNGGAIATTGTGTLKMVGGSMTGNKAGGNGAALYIVGASAQVTEVEISGNTATKDAAVYLEKTSNFTRCTVKNNAGTWGGAFECAGGILQIQGGTYEGNYAKGGGLVNVTTKKNKEGEIVSIGGLAITSSQGEGTLIKNNYATGGHGGAILFGNNGSIKIEDAVFEGNYNNSSNDAWGGAIGSTENGKLTISDCVFTGNHSKYLGGAAINLQNVANMDLSRCTFVGNYSESTGIADSNNNGNYAGGALRLNTKGVVKIDQCTFKANHVKTSAAYNHAYGGAIYVNTGGTFKINKCHFDGNYATRGGALCAWATDAKIYMNGCSFTGNWISYRYGTTIHIEKAGEFCMYNSSIADNTYTSGGTGDWQSCWLNLSTITNSLCITNCSFIGSPRVGASAAVNTSANSALVRFDELGSDNNYFINNIIVTDQAVGKNRSLANYNKKITMVYNKRSDNSANGAGGSATAIESPASNGFAGTSAYFGGLQWKAGNSAADSYWDWNGTMTLGNNTTRITANQAKSYLETANSAFKSWLEEIDELSYSQTGNSRGNGEWWPGAFQPQSELVTVDVTTFNIRSNEITENSKYPERKWSNRKAGVIEFINTNKHPFVCVQECHKSQRDDILAGCPEYGLIGFIIPESWWFADDDMSPIAIFYKKDVVSVKSSGTFWLVEGAPQYPVRSDVQKHSRCATWMRCTYRGLPMLVINTHLSYRTRTSEDQGSAEMQALRQSEMDVISKWIEDNYNEAVDGPYVLTGDFNIDQGNEIFSRYKNDEGCIGDLGRYARKRAHGYTDFGRTFNNWQPYTGDNKGTPGQLTIDHEFFWGFSGVTSYKIDRNSYAGYELISDHWPVTATYVF